MNWNWLKQPRVVGMLVAKLVLSVASPLAGQATDGMAMTREPVAQECAVVRDVGPSLAR
ncbi:MAG TPA: hypothetical protein VH088_18520 [Terriglobales bacterium]|nr:hypothetical protein [Terriglobales bacterium]